MGYSHFGSVFGTCTGSGGRQMEREAQAQVYTGCAVFCLSDGKSVGIYQWKKITDAWIATKKKKITLYVS